MIICIFDHIPKWWVIMIGKKRVIGVCVTKLQESARAEMIKKLHTEAEKNNCKIIVFNSFADFYYNDDNDAGAGGIYDLINFDIVDVLIIFCSCFYSNAVYERIILRAKEHNTPVILEDETYEGCYTVKSGYEKPLAQLMDHVIREHGARDTMFLAGFTGSPQSDARVEVYKRVLEGNGLEFSEDMIEYGGFWDEPTYEVIDRLCTERKKLPDAIFCANDTMAIAACKRLYEYGIVVPDDMIVTGFDGIRMADFSKPKISNCIRNVDGFVMSCFKIINAVTLGSPAERIYENEYRVRLSESCGCCDHELLDYRDIADEYNRLYESVLAHENYMYFRINKLMDINDMNTLYSELPKFLSGESYICLRPSFITAAAGNEYEPVQDSDLVLAASSRDSETSGYRYSASNMIPNKERWAVEHTVCTISAISVGKVTCGYYISMNEKIMSDAHMINRVLTALNIAFNAAVTDLKHRILRLDKARSSMVDPITELPNLRGAADWFDEFSSKPENHDKVLMVSVYGMPKYKYIYENYGIKAVEETVCFVAEALRIANQSDCFIAHIAEDEFIVVNYTDNEDNIGRIINNATTVFYGMIEGYNSTNGKNFYVEVNAGCTVARSGWTHRLESLIKLAAGEMYINRLKSGASPVEKERSSTKDDYNAFNALITGNMFIYHFQPIIDAKTGEIFAYEALMRTDKSIGLNPLEVLTIASDYQRLYDVERATMFNVMERYCTEMEKFMGRKVFINSIPGYFLNDEDNRILSEKYSEYIHNFVFEITEQNTVTETELHAIRRLGNVEENNPIAIDDYGTGHSNIVNLLRYSPQIIKIDRFLITNIHEDANKQMFVKSTIEFARMNNIKVLAEGVETADEMRTVAEFGVDYIQGYYTGRPALEPIAEIDPKVRAELLEAVSCCNKVGKGSADTVGAAN